jgi:hypothetical protein
VSFLQKDCGLTFMSSGPSWKGVRGAAVRKRRGSIMGERETEGGSWDKE